MIENRKQFWCVQRFSVHFLRDQIGNDVVARVLTSISEDLDEIVMHFDSQLGTFYLAFIGYEETQRSNCGVRPLLELVAVAAWHTELIGDYIHGYRNGEIVHHLQAPLPDEIVNQLAYDLDHVVFHLTHTASSEGTVDQLAIAGVRRGIVADQRIGKRPEPLLVENSRHFFRNGARPEAHLAGKNLRVSNCCQTVVVAADDPETGLFNEIGWRIAPKLFVQRVGAFHHLRVGEVQFAGIRALSR